MASRLLVNAVKLRAEAGLPNTNISHPTLGRLFFQIQGIWAWQ